MTTMSEVDEYLEHFGVKGQQWGVRRDGSGGSRKGLSSGQKKALATGGTAAAIVGLAAAEASLHRSGKLSLSSLSKGSTAAKGQQAVKHISNDAWKTQVKDFESLLKEGNDSLYKSMVTDAARAGIPTISRVDFNSIRA